MLPGDCCIHLPKPKRVESVLPRQVLVGVFLLVWCASATFSMGLRKFAVMIPLYVAVFGLALSRMRTHPFHGVVFINGLGAGYHGCGDAGQVSTIPWSKVRGITLGGRAGRARGLTIKRRGWPLPHSYICGTDEDAAQELLRRACEHWKANSGN